MKRVDTVAETRIVVVDIWGDTCIIMVTSSVFEICSVCSIFLYYIFIIKRCSLVTIYMFNIRILCLYNISYIRPSKKETSFFFKLEGGL